MELSLDVEVGTLAEHLGQRRRDLERVLELRDEALRLPLPARQPLGDRRGPEPRAAPVALLGKELPQIVSVHDRQALAGDLRETATRVGHDAESRIEPDARRLGTRGQLGRGRRGTEGHPGRTRVDDLLGAGRHGQRERRRGGQKHAGEAAEGGSGSGHSGVRGNLWLRL